MVYTEVQEKNSKKYYYRVKSVKKKNKVSKIRKYLGVNLKKRDLIRLEKEADKVIVIDNDLNYLGAVGAYYSHFPQVSDEEVIELLNSQ